MKVVRRKGIKAKAIAYLLPVMAILGAASPAWAGAEPPAELIMIFFAIVVIAGLALLAGLIGITVLVVRLIQRRKKMAPGKTGTIVGGAAVRQELDRMQATSK